MGEISIILVHTFEILNIKTNIMYFKWIKSSLQKIDVNTSTIEKTAIWLRFNVLGYELIQKFFCCSELYFVSYNTHVRGFADTK